MERRSSSLAALAVLVLLLGAGTVGAQTGRTAIGGLKVQGAHPVRGMEDGVSLSRSFGEDCDGPPKATSPEGRAVAGPAGGSVDLEISVTSCGVEAEPRVECTARILPERQSEPVRYWDSSCRCYPGTGLAATPDCWQVRIHQSSHQAAWTGWSGQLRIELPELTGIYELDLACSIDGVEQALLERTLFVTYAPPMDWVSPPASDWYRRAACWGEGFRSTAHEGEVLEGLLTGLYRYGEEHWLYGYGEQVDATTYKFPLTEDGKRSAVYELSEDQLSKCSGNPILCTCTWQELVVPDGVCNFGDCYRFSDTFTGIAATMGIGGLLPYKELGKEDLGFVTPRDAVSLDLDFQGNVRCDRSMPLCYPYDFGSHSLRQRDGLWYDATFQRIYQEPGESVGLDALLVNSSDGGGFVVSFEDFDLHSANPGYGNWNLFNIRPPTVPDETGPTSQEASVRLVGIDAAASSANAFGVSNHLNVDVTIEVDQAGEYTVYGLLVKDGKVVSSRVDYDTNTRPVASFVAQGPGRLSEQMSFSGEMIRSFGKDGPYQVHLSAHDEERLVVTRSFETGAFEAAAFGETPVEITRIFETAVDAGASEDAFVSAEMDVLEAGEYRFELRLAAGGKTLLYAGFRKDFSELTSAARAAIVEMPVPELSGLVETLPGPYTLSLQVFDEQLVAVDYFLVTLERLPGRR